jgi:hypothetical protein
MQLSLLLARRQPDRERSSGGYATPHVADQSGFLGLESGKRYAFKVVAVNDNGLNSTESEKIRVRVP